MKTLFLNILDVKGVLQKMRIKWWLEIFISLIISIFRIIVVLAHIYYKWKNGVKLRETSNMSKMT